MQNSTFNTEHNCSIKKETDCFPNNSNSSLISLIKEGIITFQNNDNDNQSYHTHKYFTNYNNI